MGRSSEYACRLWEEKQRNDGVVVVVRIASQLHHGGADKCELGAIATTACEVERVTDIRVCC